MSENNNKTIALDKIKKAKELLDIDAITLKEYEKIKKKYLNVICNIDENINNSDNIRITKKIESNEHTGFNVHSNNLNDYDLEDMINLSVEIRTELINKYTKEIQKNTKETRKKINRGLFGEMK